MKNSFAGFPAEGMRFLADLKENNDREWFQPRKGVFDEFVKQPMLDLVRALQSGMMRFAPDYVADPGKTLYRIYRDVRFSKNKAPYKPHVASLFRRNGFGKDDGAGFFFLISPSVIEIVAGIYSPPPESLLAVRQHVADNAKEFRRICAKPKLVALMGGLRGEAGKRPPKGFDPKHPAIDLIKMKQYLFTASLDGNLATTPKLFPEILFRLEAMTPFVEFLNAPLLALPKTVKRFFEE